MKRLLWSQPARRDLFAIVRYYEDIDSDLAMMLLDRVEEAPLILLDYPNMGSPCGRGGIRKWHVTGTPFLLLYKHGGGDVRIVRVRHAASDWTRE